MLTRPTQSPHMQRLYGQAIRRDAGVTKTLRHVAARNSRVFSGVTRGVKEVQGTFEKVLEETADAVEEFLNKCEFLTSIHPRRAFLSLFTLGSLLSWTPTARLRPRHKDLAQAVRRTVRYISGCCGLGPVRSKSIPRVLATVTASATPAPRFCVYGSGSLSSWRANYRVVESSGKTLASGLDRHLPSRSQ